MTLPVVVPRAGHAISRRQIEPDALKVLYRLHQNNFTAYLVGGSVRDLLLGRRPKDFDVGTDAHPYQVKRLFKNCWIIGRRFRLAHVRFGTKTIEVATFRRQLSAAELAAPDEPGGGIVVDELGDVDRMVHRDNTFGTPEEDAFRRDFTINALFYDIADFSIIDYTGGLEDLKARVVRSIGDPVERFQEDPVRMIRAVSMGVATRLQHRPADRRRDRATSRRNRAQCTRAIDRGVVQTASRRIVGEGVSYARGAPVAGADRRGAAEARRQQIVAIAGGA
jgi:poly(A) polymerase